MEHEGIFYFFRHEDGKHTLVLADSASSYTTCPESHVEYSPGSLAANHILSWEHHYEFRSGKWTRTDYNFETPSTSLLTTTRTIIDLPDAPKYEIFDYPGEYVVKGVGDPVTKVRMEEEEAGHDVVNAASQCCTFTPCGKFTLEKHDVAAEDGDYMITSVRHAATEASYGSTSNGATYKNGFTCIPASVIYRPPRATPKPMVQGPQTAVVTGPPGEKIHCDKYGRVKVQFHWDRLGNKNDKSSCWVRVSQSWGGANWGGMFIPHVGQEVIVEFEEGDPDRPLITGRVYNAERMPPLELPANKTKSAIRDHGGNEIIMEGDPGKQQMRLFSPTHNTTVTLGNSYQLFTESHRKETTQGNHTETTNGNHHEDIGGNSSRKVGVDLFEAIVGKHKVEVGGDFLQFYAGASMRTYVGLLRTNIGGVKMESILGAETKTIRGAKKEVVKGVVYKEHVGMEYKKEAGTLREKSPSTLRMIKEARFAYNAAKSKIDADQTAKVAGNIIESATARKEKLENYISECSDKHQIKCATEAIQATNMEIKVNSDIKEQASAISTKASGDVKLKGAEIKLN
jgi:type VI secretion system secreted protein VgrG